MSCGIKDLGGLDAGGITISLPMSLPSDSCWYKVGTVPLLYDSVRCTAGFVYDPKDEPFWLTWAKFVPLFCMVGGECRSMVINERCRLTGGGAWCPLPG